MAESRTEHTEHTEHTEQQCEPEPVKLVWQRAHPLSPLVKAWLLIFIFFFTIGRHAVESLLSGEFDADPSARLKSGPPDTALFAWTAVFGTYWYLAALLALFLIFFIPMMSQWFFYRFAVDGQNLYLKSGAIFRTERKARLDRVQSIDVNRPFAARLLGLAELKFDVADGDSSALKVEYLSYRRARQLRDELLAQVGSLKAPAQTVAGEAATLPAQGEKHLSEPLVQHLTENFMGLTGEDERLIVKVPLGRLIGSLVFNFGWGLGLLIGIGLSAFMVSADWGIGTIITSNLAVILGVFAGALKRLNTGFNFSLSTSSSGLKTRYGLWDTTTQTLPAGRVQRLQVEQPFLWRFFGWYRVRVTLAGKSELDEQATGELLPVGTFDDVLAIVQLILPALSQGGVSIGHLREGLGALEGRAGFTVSPASARVFDWFTYRYNGFLQTPEFLLVRSGRWHRRFGMVPHRKIQGVALRQGPWQRRLGLAHLEVSVAGSALGTRVSHLDAEVARSLLVRQSQLAVLERM
ncbi:PH domain-containing protein [Rothia sp. P5766]|uniref:PH domain-containing protein n=1 Tax=unclassified Rothia (in: high G+C Gram-positive bacteria) TaxID=2689056 RepID=UPI003AE373FF